jgi:putative heme-binding domain-containing protein
MQVAYSLGAWEDPRAAAGLARLAAAAGGDPYLTAGVLSSLNEGNVSAFASAVMELAGKSGAPPSPGLLSGLLRTASGTGRVGAIAAPLAALTTAADGKFAAWQFQTLGNFLDSLEQSGLSLKKLAAEGEGLAKGVGGVDEAMAAARRTAGDVDAAVELRAAAVTLLGRDASKRAEDWRALDAMLSPQAPREIQSAVIRTLSRRKEPEAGRTLLSRWAGLTPELRGAAMDALLSRSESANLVLDAIEGKSLAVRDIDAPRRQRLLQSSTPAIRTRAAKLLAETINPDRQKVIDAFADVLILKGDVSKGREIFAKACAQCHRLGDPLVGNAVGPDLASVGDKSAQGLLIAILDPNRAVEARYVNYIATTTDDETFTGLLSGETATSITLLGPEGKQETILRSHLKELRSSNMSLMPDGLEAGLKAQDMADLIGFVRGGK